MANPAKQPRGDTIQARIDRAAISADRRYTFEQLRSKFCMTQKELQDVIDFYPITTSRAGDYAGEDVSRWQQQVVRAATENIHYHSGGYILP